MNLAEWIAEHGKDVIVLENGRHSGTLAGPPGVLSEIARALGFRHDCRNGRLGLTRPKMIRAGFGDAVGVAPNWRALSGEAINALWRKS